MTDLRVIAERFDCPKWLSHDGTVLLLCGDCLRLLPLLPDGCVDAVVTDCPYGNLAESQAHHREAEGRITQLTCERDAALADNAALREVSDAAKALRMWEHSERGIAGLCVVCGNRCPGVGGHLCSPDCLDKWRKMREEFRTTLDACIVKLNEPPRPATAPTDIPTAFREMREALGDDVNKLGSDAEDQ